MIVAVSDVVAVVVVAWLMRSVWRHTSYHSTKFPGVSTTALGEQQPGAHSPASPAAAPFDYEEEA